jgi:hypothetical protein
MTEPCKSCLPGRPNHTRQRVVTREDGARVQLCERCGSVVATIPNPSQPMTDTERAEKIALKLKAIDQLMGDVKPDSHPDYDRARILAKLRAVG